MRLPSKLTTDRGNIIKLAHSIQQKLTREFGAVSWSFQLSFLSTNELSMAELLASLSYYRHFSIMG